MRFVASCRLHFGSVIYQSFPGVSDKLTSQFTNSLNFFLFLFPMEAAASTLALTLAWRIIWAHGEVVLTLLLCRGLLFDTLRYLFFLDFQTPSQNSVPSAEKHFSSAELWQMKNWASRWDISRFCPKNSHLPSAICSSAGGKLGLNETFWHKSLESPIRRMNICIFEVNLWEDYRPMRRHSSQTMIKFTSCSFFKGLYLSVQHRDL